MGKEQRAMYDCRPRLCSRGKLELTKWRQYVCGIRPSADGALRKIRDGLDINTAYVISSDLLLLTYLLMIIIIGGSHISSERAITQ